VAGHTLDTSLDKATTTNNVGVAYTCGAGTTLLIVACQARGSTGSLVDWAGTVTYNGVALTRVDTGGVVTRLQDGTGETANSLWYMLDPPTGAAYNIVVNCTSAYSATQGWQAASFKASSGKSVFAADFTSRLTTGTNPALSSNLTTSRDGSVIFSLIGNGAQTWAPSAQSGTILFNTDAGAAGMGTQYTLQATAGAQAVSWTFGTSEDYVIHAASWYDNVATWSPKTMVMRT